MVEGVKKTHPKSYFEILENSFCGQTLNGQSGVVTLQVMKLNDNFIIVELINEEDYYFAGELKRIKEKRMV